MTLVLPAPSETAHVLTDDPATCMHTWQYNAGQEACYSCGKTPETAHGEDAGVER